MELIVKKCGSGGAFEAIYPKKIDLKKLKKHFETIVDVPDLIIIKTDYEITIYKNGKMLIKGCESMANAKKEYEKIWEYLK